MKMIEEDGWYFARQKGSHRQFLHPTKPGKTTIAGHMNEDVHPKTLQSILKQAGLR